MAVIPKSFKLANRTWKVRLVTTKKLQKLVDEWGLPAATGLCDPNTCTIYLDKELSRIELEHAWFHEKYHALKYARGETDHREVEVEALGALDHQLDQTRKGEQ